MKTHNQWMVKATWEDGAYYALSGTFKSFDGNEWLGPDDQPARGETWDSIGSIWFANGPRAGEVVA